MNAPARALGAEPLRRARPQPGTGVRRRLEVAPDPALARRLRFRRRVALALLVGAVAGPFGVVGLHVRLAEGQAEIDALRAQVDARVEQNESLRLEVATATSPAAVLAAARALGMVEPESVVTLRPVPWAELSEGAPVPAQPGAGSGP